MMRITTLIPNSATYEIFKFIPVPQSTWRRYYIFDNVHDGPVALSTDNTDYTFINLQNCIDLNHMYYCKITYPVIRTLSSNDNCYAHIIRDRTDDYFSKKYFDLADILVIALSNGYLWYILPRSTETLTVRCLHGREEIVVVH